jgi:hypothetical protein
MPNNQTSAPKTEAPQRAAAQEGAAPDARAAYKPTDELRAALTAPAGLPSADELWQVHRHSHGGESSASGQPLPEKLADAPEGARRAHYALARYVAKRLGAAPAEAPGHLPDGIIDEVSALLEPPPG